MQSIKLGVTALLILLLMNGCAKKKTVYETEYEREKIPSTLTRVTEPPVRVDDSEGALEDWASSLLSWGMEHVERLIQIEDEYGE